MKNNKIIIYDDSCPLCAAYTSVFVSTGMIKKENRKNFTTIDPALLSLLNTKRCNNEIPVIDEGTQEVLYGIDAITAILSVKLPWVQKVINLEPVKWLLTRFYKMISYNRRSIVGTKNRTGNFDCTPDFNYRYRIFFMFICLVFNTFMLLPIHSYIISNSSLYISIIQLQAAHFVLVSINIMTAAWLGNKKAIEYLGQVNMLALTAVLAVIPLLWINKYQVINNVYFNDIYLLFTTLFIAKEYKRRMDYAGIIKHYPFIIVINMISLSGFIIYMMS